MARDDMNSATRIPCQESSSVPALERTAVKAELLGPFLMVLLSRKKSTLPMTASYAAVGTSASHGIAISTKVSNFRPFCTIEDGTSSLVVNATTWSRSDSNPNCRVHEV